MVANKSTLVWVKHISHRRTAAAFEERGVVGINHDVGLRLDLSWCHGLQRASSRGFRQTQATATRRARGASLAWVVGVQRGNR